MKRVKNISKFIAIPLIGILAYACQQTPEPKQEMGAAAVSSLHANEQFTIDLVAAKEEIGQFKNFKN